MFPRLSSCFLLTSLANERRFRGPVGEPSAILELRPVQQVPSSLTKMAKPELVAQPSEHVLEMLQGGGKAGCAEERQSETGASRGYCQQTMIAGWQRRGAATICLVRA